MNTGRAPAALSCRESPSARTAGAPTTHNNHAATRRLTSRRLGVRLPQPFRIPRESFAALMAKSGNGSKLFPTSERAFQTCRRQHRSAALKRLASRFACRHDAPGESARRQTSASTPAASASAGASPRRALRQVGPFAQRQVARRRACPRRAGGSGCPGPPWRHSTRADSSPRAHCQPGARRSLQRIELPPEGRSASFSASAPRPVLYPHRR